MFHIRRMSFMQRACSEHITHMLSYKKHLRVDAMGTLVNVVAYDALVVYHTAGMCVVRFAMARLRFAKAY